MTDTMNNAPTKSSQRDFLKVSLVFWGAALLTLLLWIYSPSISAGPAFFVGYILILLFIAAIQIVMVRYLREAEHQEYAWLHPPSLITVWTLLSFGLPGVVSFFLTNQMLLEFRAIGLDYQFFIMGWLLITVGCMVIWTGYIVGFRFIRPFGFMTSLSRLQPNLPVTLIAYMFVLLARVLRISSTGIGYFNDRTGLGILEPFTQVLSLFEGLSLLILAIVAQQVFAGRWPRFFLVLVAVSELVAAFSSGFSKPVLAIGIVILVIAIFSGMNRKQLLSYAAVLAVIGILVIPISEELRINFGSYDNKSPLATLAATRSAFASTWGAGLRRGATIAGDKAAARNVGISYHPGIIMMKTPSEVPYLGLDEMALIPTYFIPRFLWRSKPELSKGIWFSIVYMHQPADTRTSGGVTIFGESYLYAGWFSAVGLLFLFGVLLAAISRNTFIVGLVALYAALIPTLADVDSGVVPKFIGLIQACAIYALFMLVIGSFSKED